MGSSTTLFTIVFLAILAVALLAVLSGNKNSGLKLPVGVSGEAADMKKAFLGIVKSEIKSLQSPYLPDCEDTIMDVIIKDLKSEDFSNWSWDDGFHKIALAVIFNASFDLLATQRFTLAPGFFNPLGQQLHGVMNRSLEKACSKGYVSQAEIEETKKVFRQTVLDI